MKPENENGFLKRTSIRYMIFVYFTVTALCGQHLYRTVIVQPDVKTDVRHDAGGKSDPD